MHGGTIVLLAMMVLTLIVLLVGVLVMAKGGEFSKKYGNKMMALRVACQALTLALFALLLVTRK